MQEGRDRKALKSQKQHSHSSVISSAARPPTHGQYLKESALRWKIAGQTSEFKKRLEDSTSDRACHSQLRHRTSAPHQPPHGRGPGALSCCTFPVPAPLPGVPLILPHAAPSTQTSSMHRSKWAEDPRTGTPDGCRGPLRRRHQLAAAFSGGREQPAQPSSTAANFQGSGCLKTACRLCSVGAEPARAAGKVTQADTDVQEGRSPPRNPFGAAALQGRPERLRLRAQARLSRPGA